MFIILLIVLFSFNLRFRSFSNFINVFLTYFSVAWVLGYTYFYASLCDISTLVHPGKWLHTHHRRRACLWRVSGGRGCRVPRERRTLSRSVCTWTAARRSAGGCACGGCWRPWTPVTFTNTCSYWIMVKYTSKKSYFNIQIGTSCWITLFIALKKIGLMVGYLHFKMQENVA